VQFTSNHAANSFFIAPTLSVGVCICVLVLTEVWVPTYNVGTRENNTHYLKAIYNRYFHTDALGSITAITDDSGMVIERRSYEPFGKIRAMDYGTNHNTIANTTIETARAFTGHEQIAEINGLIHMNARVYDSHRSHAERGSVYLRFSFN